MKLLSKPYRTNFVRGTKVINREEWTCFVEVNEAKYVLNIDSDFKRFHIANKDSPYMMKSLRYDTTENDEYVLMGSDMLLEMQEIINNPDNIVDIPNDDFMEIYFIKTEWWISRK